MWNMMMCDVMPTISEDNVNQQTSQLSGDEANFEQLMVDLLDERDKLMEKLQNTQTELGQVEKERRSLQRQLQANLPQMKRNKLLKDVHLP
ncbi:liprin-alpha-2-like [Limulus polyphemus]|uniref:Liprin-alpha-2-like n=1 Tax=Limulus polyphemus TaxID=6850 RepID=A0ABM1TR29_LIMPO|nr:liprin-alpha-2-like [Limulus polyphemus]